MQYYLIYGLTIASPISFPEADEIQKPDHIDATIRIGQPPQWVIDEYKTGSFSSLNEQVMWFRLYDEILIYVENGSDICVWVLKPNIPDIHLRSYILTGALTFVMFQRQYLLVHGSAIAYRGKAFIISGPSGSGKSTTTLELLKQQDISFATDDICALTTAPEATTLFPGPPWQKVCADVKEADPLSEYHYLWEGEKYARRLSSGYVNTPLPVGGMFLITKDACEAVSIRALTGLEKLEALTHNLFRGELLHILGITPARMQQFLTVVGSFPIYEITRPQNGDTKTDVLSFILHKLGFYI